VNAAVTSSTCIGSGLSVDTSTGVLDGEYAAPRRLAVFDAGVGGCAESTSEHRPRRPPHCEGRLGKAVELGYRAQIVDPRRRRRARSQRLEVNMEAEPEIPDRRRDRNHGNVATALNAVTTIGVSLIIRKERSESDRDTP
jgi:hypothetical protein